MCQTRLNETTIPSNVIQNNGTSNEKEVIPIKECTCKNKENCKKRRLEKEIDDTSIVSTIMG